MTRHLSALTGAVALVALAASPASALNLVENGSFETTTATSPGAAVCVDTADPCTSRVGSWSGDGDGLPGGSPSGLGYILFPGTGGSGWNSGIGLSGNAVPDSPDGGNYIAIDGDPVFVLPIFQTIDGLIPGQEYTLTFWQAAAQQIGQVGVNTEQWQVTFGTETLLSDLMTNVTQGIVPWNQQLMTFVASASSQLLTFLAVGTPGGQPPIALLDGVSVEAVAVPEPSSVALLVTGLLGSLGIIRSRRRSRRKS